MTARESACPTHPAEPIIGACERCGDFICALDSKLVEGKRLCARCAPQMEADYLERYRRELWGKMDGWVALFGIICPAATALGLLRAPPLEAAFAIGGIAIFVAYLFRQPWARVALFALPLAAIGLAIPYGRERVLQALALCAVPTALVAVAYVDPRNRLAFRLDVTQAQLKWLWDRYRDNPAARNGLAVSFVGLLLWPLLPVGMVLGIYGLTRVDPRANPPIGGRWRAIAAVVISLAGAFFWLAVLLPGPK